MQYVFLGMAILTLWPLFSTAAKTSYNATE